MTPEQKVKHLILIRGLAFADEPAPEGVTALNIDEMYDNADTGNGSDGMQDARYEIRAGEVETDLPSQDSRHYESKEVAAKAPDGSWVGWTYWYGGGKYGEPEAIDWMGGAYSLDCTEEEKLVTVRTFEKTKVSA